MSTRSTRRTGAVKSARPGKTTRTPGRKTRRLTLLDVVDEAVALLGEEGLNGLSLRRLAGRLHIRAPSLYSHVPDKATLLSAVMEQVFGDCVRSLEPHEHWQEWMREFAAALWRAQEGVRDFGRLLMSTPMDEAQVQRIEQLLGSRLSNLDIPLAEAMRIQSSVQVLVTGWFIFAHTPFSPVLSRRMDFRKRAMHDVELLLDGEARRQSPGER